MPPLTLRAPEGPDYPELDFGTTFAAAIAAKPEKTAVVDETSTMNWAAFGTLAFRIAGRLAQDGVGAGTPVAALADNSAPFLALYAGIVLAGGCVVPLPTSANADTLAKMLADCGAQRLFASAAHMETARSLNPDALAVENIDTWAGSTALPAPVTVAPGSPFDLIYSSGTTGTPKGILHDHRFRSRQLERMPRFGLDADARLMMSTPLYSNTTLVAALPVLAKGGTIISMAKFDATRFLELSQTHAATHAMLVPVQYMRLMKVPDFDRYDLSAYRVKLSTSAPLPAPLIRDVTARWPGGLFEFYGMTEGGVSTVLDCVAFPDKLDTVGKPVQGCDVRLIDEEGVELPATEFGEIVGRSGSMMACYLNAEDKTQEILWRSPEGDDFIRTGDMGRFDEDGFLHLMDRRKDMIISGGFNIYAADLERVLRGHAAVQDVAVIAVPSADWGESPLALVVLAEGHDTGSILNWANAQLGRTQRLVALEARPDLPRNAIGKIDKRSLRAPYWDQPTVT